MVPIAIPDSRPPSSSFLSPSPLFSPDLPLLSSPPLAGWAEAAVAKMEAPPSPDLRPARLPAPATRDPGRRSPPPHPPPATPAATAPSPPSNGDEDCAEEPGAALLAAAAPDPSRCIPAADMERRRSRPPPCRFPISLSVSLSFFSHSCRTSVLRSSCRRGGAADVAGGAPRLPRRHGRCSRCGLQGHQAVAAAAEEGPPPSISSRRATCVCGEVDRIGAGLGQLA
ncbi:hypothetical protein BRADI_3g30193v3 [Brachypodium distachyon]|uniref:Uncharacterized protein n=1 Tax=Brachypodium distachyon TaxID=15368 RepID=A0A0Q3HUY4_BRADI|nr:hypothetical protein BRADI_3g30193v3 [Brachypodium distachyon]